MQITLILRELYVWLACAKNTNRLYVCRFTGQDVRVVVYCPVCTCGGLLSRLYVWWFTVQAVRELVYRPDCTSGRFLTWCCPRYFTEQGRMAVALSLTVTFTTGTSKLGSRMTLPASLKTNYIINIP